MGEQDTEFLGTDSIEFRTLMECENGMQVKVEECLAYEGWMVDNILSITDFKTNKNYEVEDMRTGGCEGLGKMTQDHLQQTAGCWTRKEKLGPLRSR